MGAHDQGAEVPRWKVIPRTLCFITHGEDVVLMKRGEHRRVFPGRYNGIGGHIERDEDPFGGALREIREETGLVIPPSTLRLHGITQIDAGVAGGIMLFVFSAVATSRDLIASDEGALHWIPLNAIQDLPCVEDVPIYLARVFGESSSQGLFFAHVHYDSADQMVFTFGDTVG